MDANINRLIGMGLRKKRTELNLTQKQLAKRLGKLQAYVSKMELGERSLQASEVFEYARALEISWIELMSEIQTRIESGTTFEDEQEVPSNS